MQSLLLQFLQTRTSCSTLSFAFEILNESNVKSKVKELYDMHF